MKIFRRQLLFVGWWVAPAVVLLVATGCVPVPVPLVRHSSHIFEFNPDSPFPAIEVRTSTWYLPVAMSAEGPARSDFGEYEYTYFLLLDESKKKYELPWLHYKSRYAANWLGFRSITGTPCFWAVRQRWDPEKPDAPTTPRPPEGFSYYDVVVFDVHQLKHRRVLTVQSTATDSMRVPVAMHVASDARSIEYLAPTGWKRYHTVEDTEESIPAPKKESEV